ncbi:serine hydrolase [Aquimarina addita]|uniref:Serine hydrolase n=2 Tax=Aquimarina addita TaxID=870485 RepID=A0ABP6UQ42_9FLAO
MCSSVFIGERSVDYTDLNDNNFFPVDLANDEVFIQEKYSEASVYGFKERKAIYRKGLGSTLINDNFDLNATYLTPNRSRIKTNLSYPYGDQAQKDTVFEGIDYDKIREAVASVFDKEAELVKKTRAVMVLHKDQIISEKYVDGFSQNSMVSGWSMAKSILATVYGVLEKQGEVNINNNAPIETWKNDERKEITINNLLQMNSGLEWEEDYESISDVTKMLYIASDMTKSQMDKKAIHKPGEHWYYSSGITNLLSGILRNQFDTYQEYLDYPYREFIDKIGMHSMVIETDMAGNFVGSSYAWATVKDWAKFGLLYLHRGNWNGQQVFDSEWFDYVTTPSPTSNGEYGAHFWLNTAGISYPDAPSDMFFASGYQGQRIFIIPSKDLVIVRFGLSEDEGVDLNKFIKEIVSAIE